MAERVGTQYASVFPRPEDAVRDREEEARKDGLRELQTGRDPEELEGVAEFNAEFASKVAGMGGSVFTASPVDAAIGAAKARSAASAEARSLTGEQRLAKAIAAELKTEVAAPPDLSEFEDEQVEQVDEQDEADDDTTLYSWYDEGEDRVYAQYADGRFLQDGKGNYVKYGPGTDVYEEAVAAGEAQGELTADEEDSVEDWTGV